MSRQFLDRSSIEVAPDLLGCVLEHETPDGLVAVELTEVEAYAGEVDPASHAYRGRTARNAVMFGPAGYAYVYFTYGMHFCVNVVCMPPGTASAVLLRAGRVITGEDLARHRRAARPTKPKTRPSLPGRAPTPGNASLSEDPTVSGGAAMSGDRQRSRDLARGPARLCQSLGIDRSLDGTDLCAPGSPLRLRARPGGPPEGERRRGTDATARSGEKPLIRTGPRVGVREAAEVPWRFWLDGDPTVSVYRPHVPRRR